MHTILLSLLGQPYKVGGQDTVQLSVIKAFPVICVLRSTSDSAQTMEFATPKNEIRGAFRGFLENKCLCGRAAYPIYRRLSGVATLILKNRPCKVVEPPVHSRRS